LRGRKGKNFPTLYDFFAVCEAVENFQYKAPNSKWFDRLTTLSYVEGQYRMTQIQMTEKIRYRSLVSKIGICLFRICFEFRDSNLIPPKGLMRSQRFWVAGNYRDLTRPWHIRAAFSLSTKERILPTVSPCILDRTSTAKGSSNRSIKPAAAWGFMAVQALTRCFIL